MTNNKDKVNDMAREGCLDHKKIIFWGSPLFAVASLKKLVDLNLIKAVVTQPDRPMGRSKKPVPTAVKEYALEHGIKVLEAEKLDDIFVEELKQYLPASFLVVAYGKIIPQEILDLSDLQVINIHPSKLPILRGPSPIQTALLKGFDYTAVSLIQIDKKMDHGPILSQIEAKISQDDDYNSLSERLSKVAADLLSDTIVDYLDGKLKGEAQDDNNATFSKMIKKEDGQINWSKSAEEINNMVRAYSLWPSAYTSIKGIDFKILAAKIIDKDLSPNEIFLEDDKFIVGTGDKSIEIIKIQPSGKKAMSAADFVRGYRDKLI